MSYDAMGWAMGQTYLEASEKLVLLALASCENSKTRQCNPSVDHLTLLTSYSSRTIRQAIKALQAAGCIKVTPTFKNGQQVSNDYQILYKTGEGNPDWSEGYAGLARKISQGGGAESAHRISKRTSNDESRKKYPAKAGTKEPEYDAWPDQAKENPQVKNLNSKNLAIDFQEQTRVHFGQLVVTNIPALAGSLARFHKAGIPYEEIKACLDYFFQMPSKYMWKDAIPWRAFVKNWLKIRKDCDWTDPNAKPTYKPIMKRPVGSRKIIYND